MKCYITMGNANNTNMQKFCNLQQTYRGKNEDTLEKQLKFF